MGFKDPTDEENLQKRRPFNVSSKRFSTPAACVNVCPGPGVYTGETAACWQYGSLGRKGYGAMASSSKRLTGRLQYTGPGPAAYSPQDLGSRHSTAVRLVAQASSNHGSPAAAAHHSSSTASSVAPPPGAYDCSVTRHGEAVAWSARPGAAAAFKASARQPLRQRAPAPQLPALQQQLHQQATSASATQHDQHRQRDHGSKAAWAAAVPRGNRVGLTSAQLAHRISAAVLGGRSTSAPPCGSCCTFDEAARAAAEVPAVGSYDVVSVGAISSNLQRRLAENRCSPMFAQPLLQSREPQFPGKQQQSQQPTPLRQAPQGQHRGSTTIVQQGCLHYSHDPSSRVPLTASDQRSSRVPAVTAPFRSTSPGHAAGMQPVRDAALAGAPGPAFCRPGLLPSKTSHRRATSPEAATTFMSAV